MANYLKLTIGTKDLLLQPISPEKFECDDTKAREYLNEHGYVVFKDVANKEEVNGLTELFWENMEIESEGRIKRGDMNTWENYSWQGYVKAGINDSHGLPQSKFAWHARGLPKVRRLFETIWQNDDLLVSFDAVGAFRPPEVNEKWKTQRGWFHVDQNGYVKQGQQAVQGLLNLIPNGPQDGGLVVVPKSNQVFETIFKRYKNLCEYYGPDYAELNRSNIKELWESDLQPIKVCLDEGDFVCWDSRTVHCNHPALERESAGLDAYLRRLVVYVCMTPTSSVTPEALEKVVQNRVAMYEGGYSGSHWPHEIHSLDHNHPYAKGNTPALTLSQWELVVGKERAKTIPIPPKGNEEEKKEEEEEEEEGEEENEENE